MESESLEALLGKIARGRGISKEEILKTVSRINRVSEGPTRKEKICRELDRLFSNIAPNRPLTRTQSTNIKNLYKFLFGNLCQDCGKQNRGFTQKYPAHLDHIDENPKNNNWNNFQLIHGSCNTSKSNKLKPRRMVQNDRPTKHIFHYSENHPNSLKISKILRPAFQWWVISGFLLRGVDTTVSQTEIISWAVNFCQNWLGCGSQETFGKYVNDLTAGNGFLDRLGKSLRLKPGFGISDLKKKVSEYERRLEELDVEIPSSNDPDKNFPKARTTGQEWTNLTNGKEQHTTLETLNRQQSSFPALNEEKASPRSSDSPGTFNTGMSISGFRHVDFTSHTRPELLVFTVTEKGYVKTADGLNWFPIGDGLYQDPERAGWIHQESEFAWGRSTPPQKVFDPAIIHTIR